MLIIINISGVKLGDVPGLTDVMLGRAARARVAHEAVAARPLNQLGSNQHKGHAAPQGQCYGHNSGKRGNRADYLTARIARDRPGILKAFRLATRLNRVATRALISTLSGGLEMGENGLPAPLRCSNYAYGAKFGQKSTTGVKHKKKPRVEMTRGFGQGYGFEKPFDGLRTAPVLYFRVMVCGAEGH